MGNILIIPSWCLVLRAGCMWFVLTVSRNVSDEETEGLFLVDFTQKIIDKKREAFAEKEREDGERSTSPVPPPQTPDEEW